MLHRFQQKYTNWILHSVPQSQDIQHPQPTQCNAIRYAERHPYSNAQGSDFSLIAPDSNAQGQFKQDKNENRKQRKPRNATTNKTKKHIRNTQQNKMETRIENKTQKTKHITHTIRAPGYSWVSPGYCWVFLRAPGCLLDAPGCCWVLLGAAGCCWVLMCALCALEVPTGSSWVLLGASSVPPGCLLEVSLVIP